MRAIEWAPVVRRKVSEATTCGTPPHGIPMPWTSRVEIARAIYDRVQAGVATVGETAVDVETSWVPVTIRFSRPDQTS